MLTKKEKRAIFELVLGIVLQVPSVIDIFEKIFEEILKSGNNYALIGLITCRFLGVLFFLDTIAIICGFKNLGNLLEYLGYEEDD